MKMKLIVLFMLLFYGLCVQAQEKNPFKINGSMSLHYDAYMYDAQNYASFRARYPDNLVRFNANASIQLGKYFKLPFSVSISNQKTLYNLPSLPEENIVDFVRNPKNNVSIHPEYKWVKAHIGTHSPSYSKLTTGDINIFGAGIDINPGKFIFSANYGTSQRAVEGNSIFNIIGAYEQKMIATRIGFGKIEGSKFTLNIVKVKDDINSITTPIATKPIEGITIAPLVQVKFGKNVFFKTETAASVYTSDLLHPFALDGDITAALKDVITVNASSKGDFSHVTSLEWKSKKITLGGEVKYIGPGFVPVGFRNIEKDILDYKLKTGLKLFKGKTSVNAMFGIRTNNVQNTTLQSTKRLISNFNVFSQINKAFSINLSYANFGFNNNVTDDNLKIEMINNTFSITPTYRFKTKEHDHQMGLNANFNSFDQFDTTTANFIKSTSKSYSLNYNVLFKKIPLNINLIGLHLNNNTPVSNFTMNNLGVTFGYKLMKKKITPSLGINYVNIARDLFTSDKRFSTRLKLKYKITKKLRFKFSYKLNNYAYGSSKPNALLNENKFKFSLLKKF